MGMLAKFRALFQPRSLRGRYVLVSCVVVVLVITGAALVHTLVTHTGNQNKANVELREQALSDSFAIQQALRLAQDGLYIYILAPADAYHREWETGIERAIEYSHRLGASEWIKANHLESELEALQADLDLLKRRAAEAIEIRSNPEKWMPVMRVMSVEMLPAHTDFYSAATLALEDIAADGVQAGEDEIYRNLTETRHLWSQMIAAFRVYVANRAGVFSPTEDGLKSQIYNVELYHHQVMDNIAAMRNSRADKDHDFQITDSLDTMAVTAARWLTHFQSLRPVDSSGNWRADIPFLQDELQPLSDRIWTIIRVINHHLGESAAQDLGVVSDVAFMVTSTLWFTVALGLLLAVGGFIYFDRVVLRPVSQVALALRAESAGLDVTPLPTDDLEETQCLIDAFSELRRHVHERQVDLEHQALHDALTGLPNRTLLQDRLDQAIEMAKRKQHPIALLMMDLDRFKEINDTLGHQFGDSLLIDVSRRLRETVRPSDTVARLGGDEFAAILPATDASGACIVAQKILHALDKGFEVDNHTMFIGSSIGIAMYPAHGDSGRDLLKKSDVAMYVAKRGSSGYSLYNLENDPHSMELLQLTNDLRAAINANELELHYQPKVDISTGEVTGVEALLRWHHPQHGFVAPDRFIAIAERSGMIKSITSWVLEAGLRQCARWCRAGRRLPVSINLSVVNMQDPELFRQIKECIAAHGVPPELLELEITESAVMVDPQRALELTQRLSAMGVSLSVDDFGTGYSSLAYLRRLPLTSLKIDKSFVLELAEVDNENDPVIVRSIIDLAHNIGLSVIAEGVEDQDIWDVLEILRCDQAQGYYLSPAMSAKDLDEWLNTYEPRRSLVSKSDSDGAETLGKLRLLQGDG